MCNTQKFFVKVTRSGQGDTSHSEGIRFKSWPPGLRYYLVFLTSDTGWDHLIGTPTNAHT